MSVAAREKYPGLTVSPPHCSNLSEPSPTRVAGALPWAWSSQLSSQDRPFVTTLTDATDPLLRTARDGEGEVDESPTAPMGAPEDPTSAQLDIDALLGRRIGRYVVLERLGAGGMGIVLRAYDPDLDRQVALKVLSTRVSESDPQNERLYREAQALARLAHENVVAVHDVGRHEGCVFVAMELVDGQTLTVWLRTQKRRRREIVEAFCAAGRGLAAAHAAGLVHRDFKPSNVMVGHDGRVRVLDFGLARRCPRRRASLRRSSPRRACVCLRRRSPSRV